MTHDEARQMVCAVCTNQWGVKAVRRVNEKEEKLIKFHVLNTYNSTNLFFPSGICPRCIHHLHQLDEGEEVQLKISENYFCHIERETRSALVLICRCEWCYLARLFGPAFLLWKRKVKGKEVKKVTRLCQECYIGIVEGTSHTCSVSTMDAIRNLANTLPKEIQSKLALEILKDKQNEVSSSGESQTIFLPPAHGGLPVPVLVGHRTTAPLAKPQFTHQEMLTMATSAHLTGNQINTIAADLRIKLGRDAVVPGLDKAVVEHNNMYLDFFSGEQKMFWDSEGNVVRRAIFWCHNVRGFLEMVASKRGEILDECSLKIGGDTGKGFMKITASLFTPNTADPVSRKKRRTREDGISEVNKFSETGQRMILLLCVVKGVPESMENLELLFTHVNLTGLKFTITGDFKFLMPWFGLLGCSSVHPCLYCNQERRKGEWVKKKDNEVGVELRTLGGIESMTGGWMEKGSKKTTAWTSQYESCVGTVTVWGDGDTPQTTVLDKCAPPTVHCLLAVNNILRPHLESIWDGDLWKFLQEEIHVIPHSYQGKEGAFEGPQCNKILNSVENKMKHHLLALGEPGKLYYNLLVHFKKFKDTFFGTVLPINYKEVAAAFKFHLNQVKTVLKFPVTPKFHMMAEHVIQWVDKHGRALGEESEQAVEAAHATFDELWDSFCVKDVESDIYIVHGKKAILKFNADHTNAKSGVLVSEE